MTRATIGFKGNHDDSKDSTAQVKFHIISDTDTRAERESSQLRATSVVTRGPTHPSHHGPANVV